MTAAESRRLTLKSAADYLRLTADDHDGMAKRELEGSYTEEFLGKRQIRSMRAQCLSEKTALLRGQADHIERL